MRVCAVAGAVNDRRYRRVSMEVLEPKLVGSVADEPKRLGFNPRTYRYLKDAKRAFGVYLYGREDCRRFLEEVGPIGKRRRKLSRFLTPPPQASIARKQPGGG